MIPRTIIARTTKDSLVIKEFEMTQSFKKKRFLGLSLLNEERPKAIIKNKQGEVTDFLVGGTSLLVISNKAKIFFEENIKNAKIEFIQVEMKNYSQKENYWVMNILERLKCFDWVNSKYTLYEGLSPNGSKMIDEIESLIFLDDMIGEKELFYSDYFPVIPFISPKFEKKLTESGLRGFEIWDYPVSVK